MKNFNIKIEMKQVTGGEVRQEAIYHYVERRETEARRRAWTATFEDKT